MKIDHLTPLNLTENERENEEINRSQDLEIQMEIESPPENENNSFQENSNIEDELEKLALKLGGRSHGDFLKNSANDEISSKSRLDLAIRPEQRLQNFADFKLVSIHPAIRNQLALRIDFLKSEIDTFKKMLKRL